MGLETPGQPIVQIDPSMIVGRDVAPAANLGASAALSQAYRAGQISVDDIVNRAQTLQQTKAKTALVTDPQVQAAEKSLVLSRAASERAQSDMASQLANVPAGVLPIYQKLVQAGVAPAVDLKKWTPETTTEVLKANQDYNDWHTQAETAKALLGDVKSGDVQVTNPDTGFVETRKIPISESTQRPVDPTASQSIFDWSTKYGANPKAWIDAGKEQVHRDLFSTPGTVKVGTPGTASAGRLIKSEAAPTPKAATEEQVKAGTFTGRALEANEVLTNLQKRGYDPATFNNWAQSWLIGPLQGFQSEDRKSYEAAKQSWLQGLLRLESGAAINKKEAQWYDNTFFPNLGDSAAVQHQKAEMRQAVEAIAANVAKTGNLDVPKLIELEGGGKVINNLTQKGAFNTGTNSQSLNIGGQQRDFIQIGNEWYVKKPSSGSTPAKSPARLNVLPPLRGVTVESK